jgi:hypothetical protein
MRRPAVRLSQTASFFCFGAPVSDPRHVLGCGCALTAVSAIHIHQIPSSQASGFCDKVELEGLPKVISVWMAIASFSEPRSGDILVAVNKTRSGNSLCVPPAVDLALRAIGTATRM